MRAAVICFTENGMRTALRAGSALGEFDPVIWIRKKDLRNTPGGAVVWEGSLGEWTKQRFKDSGLIIFVGAAGIAVRAIAPYLTSKTVDPAVLCIDEKAAFVIPLASGHLGGANEYALMLAETLEAVPVITTATDINGKFAVDVFAGKNGLKISDMEAAKRISSAVLDGEHILFESEFPVDGQLPSCLETGDGETKGGLRPEIFLGIHCPRKEAQRNRTVLRLVPAVVSVGTGCRRGTEPAALAAFLRRVLAEENLLEESLEMICSIDLKGDEPAVRHLAEVYKVPLLTFSADELSRAEGDFSSSEFVRSVTGADNVCERSAVLGSGCGRLIVKKKAWQGMTLALAVREWRGSFA